VGDGVGDAAGAATTSISTTIITSIGTRISVEVTGRRNYRAVEELAVSAVREESVGLEGSAELAVRAVLVGQAG
jgi:hypothetical protein